MEVLMCVEMVVHIAVVVRGLAISFVMVMVMFFFRCRIAFDHRRLPIPFGRHQHARGGTRRAERTNKPCTGEASLH